MSKVFINYVLGFFTTKHIVVEKKYVTVEVLSKGAVERLRKQLDNPIITSSDTPSTVAHKLGVQRAILVVEQGFSV